MIIKDAKFINSKCTLMEVKIQKNSGSMLSARFAVPSEYQKGVNKYFDMVLEKFDINQLKEETQKLSEDAKKYQNWKNERQKNNEKSAQLNQLFQKKISFLESVIMKDSTVEQRKIIRKVNTLEKFLLVQHEIIKDYANHNNISFFEAVMLMDQSAENGN